MIEKDEPEDNLSVPITREASLFVDPPAAKLTSLPCVVRPSNWMAWKSKLVPDAVFSIVMSSPVVSVKRTLFEEYVVAVTPVVGVIAFIFVIASDTLELLMEKLLVEVPFKEIV